MYLYLKALHIIFIVTWFAGMFYIVRLFIYNTEAGDREEPEKTILRRQFTLMSRRLWLGITWPSAILTLVLGLWTWYLLGATPMWLLIKLFFVAGLFVYHITLQVIYRQQMRGKFKFTSMQLRVWNEVATIFLVAIVMLVTVKENMSWLRGLIGLLVFVILIMGAIRLYKTFRESKK